MCLKERWRSTVNCLISICLTGHLFVCRWSNTQRRWAKHDPGKWWARKPRVKWSPTWERDSPRPRIHGLGRKWPNSFIPHRKARDHFRILGFGLELACSGGSCGSRKLGSSPKQRLWKWYVGLALMLVQTSTRIRGARETVLYHGPFNRGIVNGWSTPPLEGYCRYPPSY